MCRRLRGTRARRGDGVNMLDIVTERAQIADQIEPKVLVELDSHSDCRHVRHRQVLLRCGCGECDDCTDILRDEGREVPEKELLIGTFGETGQNRAQRHASAADDRLPTANGRIANDALAVIHESSLAEGAKSVNSAP